MDLGHFDHIPECLEDGVLCCIPSIESKIELIKVVLKVMAQCMMMRASQLVLQV